MWFSKLHSSFICTDVGISVENSTNCFGVFDYGFKAGIRNKRKILTIEWQQQNYLNSLRITYIFKRNIYFDIEIDIYDKNNNKLYTSLLNADVSIKCNQFVHVIILLWLQLRTCKLLDQL